MVVKEDALVLLVWQTLVQRRSRKKGFIWALLSLTSGTRSRRSVRQLGPIASTVRKQTAMNTDAQLSFSFLFTLSLQPIEWCCSLLGYIFPPQLTYSRISLTDRPQSLPLFWFFMTSTWQSVLTIREVNTINRHQLPFKATVGPKVPWVLQYQSLRLTWEHSASLTHIFLWCPWFLFLREQWGWSGELHLLSFPCVLSAPH